jgi:threonine dehydrogenase-like Zn-dependent dehydrogenase
MGDTCRAAVFLGDGRYEVRELPVPAPPPGGAVLQVEAVGLCGSDVAQFHGVELVPGGSAFPVVPGHETVGRVVALAPDAALGVSEGDRVAVDEILSIAPAMRIYGYSDMTGEGRVGLWGGYGEYMELFAGTRLHRLPDDVPAAELTVFEPLANAVHWVALAGVQEGDTVVVQGPGHQGLAVLEAVLARRPSKVVVTGTAADELRLSAAREIGAALTVDAAEAVTAVRDLTGGFGADVVFDVATAVQTVPLSVDLVRFQGTVLLAGLKHFAEVPGFVSD